MGLLSTAPADADAGTEGYGSWAYREDGTVPGTGTTYSWSGVDAGLNLGVASVDGAVARNVILVYGDPSLGHGLGAQITAPDGQIFEAGETYPVFVGLADPTARAGQLLIWREGTVCGKTFDEVSAYRDLPEIATGTLHIGELERDQLGRVTRFAATYVLSCQLLGGPPGFEGSIAVNATAPAAAVPDAPVVPGPVTDLKATNVGPDKNENTTTTLTWHNPVGAVDAVVDMIQSEHPRKLPALVGGEYTRQYLGRAHRYRDDQVEFMDTRTYRVVPRGPSGRLGAPALVTVQGSRLDVKDWLTQTVTIGQQVQFSGKLRLSWDYDRAVDVMKGPGLARRVIRLCARPARNYAHQVCRPIDRTTTAADGSFTLSGTPLANSIYDFEVPATGRMVGNILRATAWVAPVTDLAAPESDAVAGSRFARVGPRGSVRRGSVIHFSTVRAPAGSRGVVRLQRYDGDAWRTVLTKRFDTRRSGARRVAIPYRELRTGTHRYRVVKVADQRHVNGHSRTVQVRVR
jgi:hypothetical protein